MAPTAKKFFDSHNRSILEAASKENYRGGHEINKLVAISTNDLKAIANNEDLLAFCEKLPAVTESFKVHPPLEPARDLSTDLLIRTFSVRREVTRDVAAPGPSTVVPKKRMRANEDNDLNQQQYAVSEADLFTMLAATELKLNELNCIRKGLCIEIDNRTNLARGLFSAAVIAEFIKPK